MNQADKRQAERKQRIQFDGFEKNVSDKAKELFNTPPYYNTNYHCERQCEACIKK